MSIERQVTVIVPVKRWDLAKSRLELGAVARPLLARAFTLDVLEAVGTSRHAAMVVVVTAERGLTAAQMPLESRFVPDAPFASHDGLNAAIATGLRCAAEARPNSPVLVVPADLPALTRRVLDETIDLLSVHDSAYVPDADGDGTTMSWGASPEHLKFAYGPGSARRHTAQGARGVEAAALGARLDVDTARDLGRARRLGVGISTAEALNVLAGLVSAVRP
jgi:2-phospho-L-lactate/phosphoenolpyruvate guanylyltransferase